MNKQLFYNALTASNLDKHKPQMDALMKDTIRYHLTPIQDYNDVPAGSSRIGGTPDLPEHIAWPVDNKGDYLSFIAQLHLPEIKPFDTYHILPDTGYLFFFFDANQSMGGYSKEEKHLFRVIYFDGTAAELSFPDFPESLSDEACFSPCALSFETQVSMPFKWSKAFSFLSSEERDVYGEQVWKDEETNKTLGHADNLQSEMEMFCQIVTHEDYTGDFSMFEDPAYDELRANAGDWQLLLQVDSNQEHANMMWADMGRLYFWIRKQDLEKKNFDNCWCVLQDM
ncbi:YwqG family protein [Chitinophaga qingshengii]|uniref:DUF1963 domain-containing protein n=1 Tax=Chitinophaga qingshengii TaxID=1569794 RepID=A0ABR7TFJ9_9BACT|nr:YwqG family protein [Chitinophaga qingshengii]MBC9929131.1 DUF1963 domain-containing protein [Chitinophaga qingshengii]